MDIERLFADALVEALANIINADRANLHVSVESVGYIVMFEVPKIYGTSIVHMVMNSVYSHNDIMKIHIEKGRVNFVLSHGAQFIISDKHLADPTCTTEWVVDAVKQLLWQRPQCGHQ